MSERAGPHRERPFVESLGARAEEKIKIGRAAAALVVPGETVCLDVGTTTAAVARAIAERTDLLDVVVFTNGITLALELEPAIPRLTVVVTGGPLGELQHSLVDPWVTRSSPASTSTPSSSAATGLTRRRA